MPARKNANANMPIPVAISVSRLRILLDSISRNHRHKHWDPAADNFRHRIIAVSTGDCSVVYNARA